jgi:hypothetical protein
MPGTPIYKDGVVSSLYYRTKEEGKLEVIFDEDLNHDRFVTFFERIKTLQVLCRVRENKDLDPVGYAWVCNSIGRDGGRAAVSGFCFFGDAGKSHVARDLATLGIAYWIIALKIDVLHGVILDSNASAQNFASKLGFVLTAHVPKWRYVGGELVDVVNMTLEARNWLPTFEEWRKQNPVATP